MKIIKVKKGLAGKGYTFPAGSIQTVSDEKADELVRKGLATLEGEVRNTSSPKAATRTTTAKPKSGPKPPPAPKADTEKKEKAAPKPKAKPKTARKRKGRKPKTDK